MGVCAGPGGRVCEPQRDHPALALENAQAVQMIAYRENAEFFDDPYLRLSNSVDYPVGRSTPTDRQYRLPTAGS